MATKSTSSRSRANGRKAGGKASAAGREYRQLQRSVDRRESRQKSKESKKEPAVQLGARKQPAPPQPAQHQAKPGIEARLDPRPAYEAPQYRGSDKLKDMAALITGGDSGIGRAVAVLYAREGADVAIVYLAEEQVDADETRQAVEREGRRCLLIPGDVSSSRFCERAVEQTVEEFGRLDILVNNAAFQQHVTSIEELSDEQFDRTMKTNIYGYFYMARAALKHLKKGSAIINTGSVTGLEGSSHLLDYSTTKGAIHTFTRSLSAQLLERGIRVNAVAPGPVWTPLNPADSPPEEVAKFGQDVPMKRPAQPEELSPLYVFLAAPVCSSYLTGEVIPVIGGQDA